MIGCRDVTTEYHSQMVTAQSNLTEALGQALGYWNQRLSADRMQCARDSHTDAIAETLAGAQLAGIILARPEHARLLWSLPEARAHRGPLPDARPVPDWLTWAEWRLADHTQDCPRGVSIRAAELARALSRATWVQRAFGDRSRGLHELSHDWVELFLRWDWLIAGWQALGCPSSSPASALDGLETLVSVYTAQSEPTDLPFWMLSHSPIPGAGGSPLAVVGEGPIDPLLMAVAAVLGRCDPVLLRWPLLPTRRHEAWSLAWPELQDLSEGRLPDPAGWPPVQARRESAQGVGSLPLAPLITLVAAAQLESAVDEAVARILPAGNPGGQSVGVVAFDRLMARRLTVRLEQLGLGVEDGSGWSLDTTAASASIQGLVSLIEPGCSAQEAFHWAALPVVQQALGFDTEALLACYRACRMLPSRAQGFGALPAMLKERLVPLQPLQRLAATRAQRPMADWVRAVEKGLDDLGLTPLLASDEAGVLLLGSLRALHSAHLSPQGEVDLGWADFRVLLSRAFAEAKLPLRPALAAPVRIMSLSEAAWDSSLSQLILLGATESQMFDHAPSPLLARRQMDTALARQPESVERAVQLALVARLLDRGVALACIGLPDQPGVRVRWASPWVRLRAVLPGLVTESSPSVRFEEAPPLQGAGRRPPSAVSPLPRRVSVTSLQSLVVCPYQFFWRAHLGLSDWRPLSASEGPAERGTWLHRVAESVPARLQAPNPPQTQAAWETFLSGVLDELLRESETDLAFLASLRQRLSSLAAWLAEPTLALPVDAERTLEGTLPGAMTTLRGRADWVLPRGVIDLKTTDPAALKRGIRGAHQDLQLQVYAWLLSQDPQRFAAQTLAFLSVQAEGVTPLPVAPSEALIERIDQTLTRIHAGEAMLALEALGDGQACPDCPARGACRPEEWSSCSQ